MDGYEQPLSRVLDRIQQATPVSIQDYEDDGEWFLMESDKFEDPQLFGILKGQWNSIVGPNAASFALIHCRAGRECGVWLHYLGTDQDRREYLCHCHQIPCW